MTTHFISREKYDAALKIAILAGSSTGRRQVIDEILAALEIEVEKTAGERIAAFVAAYRRGSHPEIFRCWLDDLVKGHFPEAGDG